MADPILGEIRTFAFNFAPKGWEACRGQLLQISQNQALFALLGTLYGGDGRTNFALPDLQGRVAVGDGTSPAGTQFGVGEAGGEEAHRLTEPELPVHRHRAHGSTAGGTAQSPANAVWAAGQNRYRPHGSSQMSIDTSAPVGADQPHNTMQPYVPVTVCIAMVGEFPTRP
jgi:microcystin-dependent protein